MQMRNKNASTIQQYWDTNYHAMEYQSHEVPSDIDYPKNLIHYKFSKEGRP